MFKKILSVLLPNLDREVNRDLYPRHEYGDWEFIPLHHNGVRARLYSTPVMEKTFHGKNAAKDARRWVHENMHAVKKEAA